MSMEGSKHVNNIATLSESLPEQRLKNTKQPKLKKCTDNTKVNDGKNQATENFECTDLLNDEIDEKSSTVLLAWGRERAFHLLGLLCLLMCTVLFGLQAYMAYKSYQMLHQITTKRQIPEHLYQIYFDGHDWALDLDKVDLRANTSLFMH